MTDKLIEYNKILKKYWNYTSLKTEQYNVITNVLSGHDVCAILATGFGKSVCYQLPALITKKCVIVVSPLIALMHEQGEEMKNKNIPVCVFNSTSTTKEKEEIQYKLSNSKEYRLIYMTPEYLLKSQHFLQKLVEKNNLAMICIDEAHAVSTWGLDFRASYTKLYVIREWIPQIPILTLTATASTKVKEDIIKILSLDNPIEVIGNFDRPNLTIRVFPRAENPLTNLSGLLDKYKLEYIIIYCKTRDETDNLANLINNYGVKCESYHAGITDIKRNEIQQDFINGKYKCMIATIAFGMGINIPNVRLVIHFNCPKNMESYYQEIGRAGRDGLPSECYLFYSKKDFYVNRLFLKTITDDAHRAYQESQIRLIEKYVYSQECRRKLLLINFGQNVESCKNCDSCLKNLDSPNVKSNITLTNYTLQIYLLLNLISRIDNKFGILMYVNILIGKSSKIKDFMKNFDEFGVGISFGKEQFWKELIRNLINDDYLIETQVKGSFGTTLSLTLKGRNLRKNLITKFPNYLNLLQELNNPENQIYIIKYPEIIVNEKKTKTTKIKITTKKPTESFSNIQEKKCINYDEDMPTSFIRMKNNINKINSDLEEDLKEFEKSEKSVPVEKTKIKSSYQRKKNILVE